MTALRSLAWVLLLAWIPAVVVAAGPSISQRIDLRIPCEVFRLENGLTVILHRDTGSPGVSVNLSYRVGSGLEQPGETGVAHLLEHLMFEGSANVPAGAFDQWLEDAGGRGNAATGEDFTVYWHDVPPGALELALFLESDRMAYLAEGLDERQIDQQKRVVLRERDYLYDARPYASAEWAMRSALYPAGHPYATPVIGTPDDVAGLTPERIAGFYRTHYHPANAGLVIAGNIEIEPTRELVQKWFAPIPRRPAPPQATTEPVVLEEDRRVVVTDAVSAPKLSLYWPSAAAFSPDDASLVVLADVIGSARSSRLRQALIREQGLASSVSARQEGLRQGGLFSIEVVAMPGQSLSVVLGAVDEVIEDLMKRGVSKNELGRSVAGVSTEFLSEIERIGGYEGLAGRLNTYWVYTDEPDFFAQDLARYTTLRPNGVRAAARRWLGGGRVVLSIVPHGRGDLAVNPEGAE